MRRSRPPIAAKPLLAHRMRSVAGSAALAIVIAGALLGLGGCSERLQRPSVLVAPYVEEQVWAVAPFANESGVSDVDVAALGDRFVAEIEGVEGVRALPLNRTIAAMEQRGMDAIRTREDAALLLADLHADGIVLGTVSDWDPYKPLRFGAAVELVTLARSGAAPGLGVVDVAMPTSERDAGGTSRVAISQASRLFDARNQGTLRELERYAAARHDPDSALGAGSYQMRIDLFTRFGAFVLTRDLLEQEAARLGTPLPGGSAEREPDSRK